MKRIHSRTMAIASATCLAALLTACESTEKTGDTPTTQPSMGAINEKCPVMGEAVDPGSSTVDWGGQKIGFCCDGCVGKWESMSSADKNAFVAAQ